MDLLRREQRQRRRDIAAQQSGRDRLSSDPSDEQACLDRIAWLRTELAALPAEQVRLLSLRFRFGWTLDRIGKALGLKPGAVDGRLARSIADLQAKAKENLDESN